MNGHQGDRRAVRLGVRGRPLGASSDVHATGHAKSEELKTLPVDRQARVVRAGARRVPPPRGAHAELAAQMGTPTDHIIDLRGRRPPGARPTTASGRWDGCRPSTSTSTAPSATSATACCATGKVLAEEGVVNIVVMVDRRHDQRTIVAGPELSTKRLGPRGRGRADLLAEGCKRAAERRCNDSLSGRRNADRGRSSGACAARPSGKFVNQRTRRRPMIVPVVLEA
jgi:ribonuclease J